MARLDAGRGLLLRGDGTGKFSAMPAQASGLRIYGEQRGAAVGDFNEDGRPDLVVSQNGAATRLFMNVGAKPGLRLRLEGPRSNPAAIGAIVRLRYGDHLGPAREVHAGSGYLSQDSHVLVLGAPQPPSSVVVRWPGAGSPSTSSTAPAGLSPSPRLGKPTAIPNLAPQRNCDRDRNDGAWRKSVGASYER